MTPVLRLLRSPKFFYAVVLLLVLQAAWIALTARYPQAFDENYHFGLIQLHAQQWLPFFTHQPPGQAIYGAVARDPSYLYHYLLSFPYRLLTHFTDSLAVQVIVLRFINIGMFVGGLFVYRRLLSVLGVSRALSNAVLLFFVLTPVVPLLAGQINYDNLMFLLTGLLFLLLVRFYQALQLGETLPKHSFPVILALQIFAVGAFGSIVKYPFAPIFAAVMVVLAFLTWQSWRRGYLLVPRFSAAKPAKLRLAVYGLLAVIAAVLCIERYGINLVKYHSPVPKCHIILSIDECQAYSPWARDYLFAATYPRPTLKGIVVYPGVWAHRMVYETMFTITSTFWEDKAPNQTVVYYYPADPLPVANNIAWVVVILGTLATIYYWRRIWARPALRLLLTVIGVYVLVLFIDNFSMYLHTGEAVAIHGRYLVPVYPILYLMLALAIGWAAEGRHFSERYKAAMVLGVFVLFLQGAGLVTWIFRSEPSWYWPQSAVAARVNWLAHETLHTIVIR